MSKVIFLDIDGPIMTPRSALLHVMTEGMKTPLHEFSKDFLASAQEKFWLPDPVAVILITKLAEDNDAKIVISSTWRSHKNFIETDLPMLGFDKSLLHEDWATPRFSESGVRREDEINAWLEKHPEVTQFITIDDEVLDFDTHIQVCGDNGFLLDNYNQALEILTGKEVPQTSIHAKATVDFLGPQEILNDNPRLKSAVDRVRQRKEILRKRPNGPMGMW